MSHEFENERPAELNAVEQALAGLVPASPHVERDRLMFLAGQASKAASIAANIPASERREPPDNLVSPPGQSGGKLARPPRRLWPAATAALAATSLALAIALLARHEPQPQIVYVDRLIQVEAPATASKARLRPPGEQRAVFTQLPSSAPSASTVSGNYLQTRDVALRLGLDALSHVRGAGHVPPAVQAADRQPVAAATYGQWLGSLLSPAEPAGQPAHEEFPHM